MAKLKVLVDFPILEPALQKLRKIPGVEAEVVPAKEEARELPAAQLRDQQAVLCTYLPTILADMKQLKWVQICSAGYSQLFGLGLPEKGVRATNAAGVFDVPIAEWNMAMLVNLQRDLRGMIRNQESATWDRHKRFQTEIRGRVVGIWGYGGIGRQTARLAKALGLTVHVLDKAGLPSRANIYLVPGTGDPEGKFPDRAFTLEQKQEFLRGLDYLILSVPLTKNTEGMVGEAELQALPRHAFVLNPARGPLIQEPALLRALREGWIAGAALDTHYHYPMPPDHPLWKMPNVIMTPHISGSSESPHFVERVWDIFVQNVERFRTGQPLLNELSVSQLRAE